MNSIFISPVTGKDLSIGHSPLRLYNANEEFPSRDNVITFLPRTNEEYEGAYLNKIRFVPPLDFFPFTIPLWMVSHGYIWEVRKQFRKNAILCELGCASGVNYFGNRFRMIGIDFSFSSLRAIDNYLYRIQANAISLPFQNESLDGIISSFFWEHISPQNKEVMLREFHRVLKPGGKLVMLYDVETTNRLIGKLKQEDMNDYEELFLRGDYHTGYETLDENSEKFTRAGFTIKKHFGMERTIWLSNSVYTKLSTRKGLYGKFSRLMKTVTANRSLLYLHMLAVRVIDETVGRFFQSDQSRIALTVLKK